MYNTDYPDTVETEDNCDSSIVVVSYWRLQEQPATTTVPGGTAQDALSANNGVYSEPASPLDDDPGHMSPRANPIVLTLGVTPGLLTTEPTATATPGRPGRRRFR